uniref:CHK kinase-like domain-containing protein n=1 Tax=Cuerna arida TaxID=1464854 RepID=A0A1B6ENY9_9HEMI
MSQSTEDLKGLLEKALSQREGLPGLRVHEVRAAPCTKPGDNFMSVVNAVEVLGSLPGGTPYQKSVFVKWPVGGAQRSQTYHVDEAFNNESVVYLRVLPLYDVTSPCPQCYYAGRDVIVLEDLLKQGYKMGERSIGFDFPTAECSLKALAKFHAGSYHANLTKKIDFLAATDQLKPIGFFISSNRDMVETSLRRAITMVAEDEDLKDVLPVLRSFQGRVSEMLRDLRKAADMTVMGHGDFWFNNLMVCNGSEISVKIVDLQACSIMSPAVDVYSFLYTSVASSVMESDQFEQLLQIYSEAFLDNLKRLKIPTGHIPSSSDILHELKSRELYGLFIGTFYLPALELSPDVPDLDSTSKEQTLNDDFALRFFGPELKNRMRNLVRLCKIRGVLRT